MYASKNVQTDLLNHNEKLFQEHINARLPNRDVVITITSHYRHIGWISLRAFIHIKTYPTKMTTYHRPLLSMIIGFLWPILAIGQGTQSSVSGTIRDAAGEPLTGATVQIRNESTGFMTGASAGVSGVYMIQQIPLGTDYTVTASFVGYVSQQIRSVSINQGDHLRFDFMLVESAQMLEEVTVTSDAYLQTLDRIGAKTSVTRRNLETLPVNGRNFTSLIDLSPVSRGSNLLGQLFSSTNYTIDGMTNRSPLSSGTTNRGPYSISMEAIREFEIVTNSYDVSYGRSGGGLVSAVTRSGTNQFQGSAFIYNRADALASPYDTRGQKRNAEFSINQFGFTLGGPIIRDKAHFFVTYDGQLDAQPLYIADLRNESDEIVQGISRANLDRFLQIARDKYGVADSPQTGSFDKLRDTHTLFARLDWQLDKRHLLTVRNNFTRDMNNQGVNDNSRINLYEVYGTHLSMANSLMASLRSSLGGGWTNELKVQHLYTLDDGRPSDQLPSASIPRAIVENISSTINGNTYRTTIQIGGQRYLPETFESNVFQVANNLYLVDRRGIQYTVGADIMLNNLSSLATSEFNGRFFFTGLDNFDNLTPYRYAREVAFEDPEVVQNILGAGFYGQAQWQAMRDVNLTLGLRMDFTNYFASPERNTIVQEDLGLRTDKSASGFQLQPRVQAVWNIGGKNTDIVKVGAGVFGSALNNYSDVNNLQFDGSKVSAIDVRGALVPRPDFPGYRNDPSTAPGVDLLTVPGVNPATTINMNSEDLKVPTVYKANVNYNRFFGSNLRLGVNLIGSFARDNYMYVDRNMVDDPFFRLANEGNRGVFVPANTINTTNGSADWTRGRKTTRIGRVLELVSEGKNDTYTTIVDGSWNYFRDGTIHASYTWNESKDNTSYNGNVANSATLSQMVVDDPRDLSTMSFSNAHYRNKVVFYGTLPTVYGVEVGIRYSGIGGTRYSLRVSGNVNGDFVSSNDLAYVFDPADAATNPTIATDMQTVLDNPNNLARACIRESLGGIADRNGCENEFFGTWDLRVARKFMLPGQKRTGMELALDVFNVANLIDKTWGTTKNLGDQNLLTIRGFNATTQEYTYAVNQNVGVINPGGTPWQFQVSARILF